MVVWQDVTDCGHEWQDGLTAPVIVRSTGFLLNQTPQHVVLVRDYVDHDGSRTLGDQVAIPVGCVKRVILLDPRT